MTPDRLEVNKVYQGDARKLLPRVAPNSVAVAFWSPPYFVGKDYEKDLRDYACWRCLIEDVVKGHEAVIKPGGFLAININDVLCFPDNAMPRVMAESGKRSPVTREQVIALKKNYPCANRQALADMLGCSEQTVDRRLKGNNVRGGKYQPQTKVKLAGTFLEMVGEDAGFYLYDRRAWVKDPCWANCQWHSNSYRSVDEFEYVYVFWKPGPTKVDRSRLMPGEWAEWGSRGVWRIPSVRRNDDHEAKFPAELAARVIRLLSDPGDVVLDCFAGSGTTLVAAKVLGRRYLGFEILPKYVALCRRNLGGKRKA